MRRVLPLLTLAAITVGMSHSAFADDPPPFSDEFNDAATLSQWHRHCVTDGWPDQTIAADIDTTSAGHLYIEPEVCTWYRDYRGVYLYKEITGDFTVTTRVNVTGLSTAVPTASFSLAGVMVRAPRDVDPETWTTGGENWLFIAAGTGNTPGSPQIETKDTIDSNSNLILTPSVTGWIRLRIERVGSTFNLYRRFPGQDWVLSRVIVREDMPETLQVGLHAYTDWDGVSTLGGGPYSFNSTIIQSPPGHRDMIAQFDWVRFQFPNPIPMLETPQAVAP